MPGYGFKAFVPIGQWLRPSPVITKFFPGHDARILSSVGPGEKEVVPIEIHFSDEMKCVDVLKSISFNSKTPDDSVPWIDESSISCNVTTTDEVPEFVGQVATSWVFSAKLRNVSNGVHRVTITNATTEGGLVSTNVSSSHSRRMILVTNCALRPWIIFSSVSDKGITQWYSPGQATTRIPYCIEGIVALYTSRTRPPVQIDSGTLLTLALVGVTGNRTQDGIPPFSLQHGPEHHQKGGPVGMYQSSTGAD